MKSVDDGAVSLVLVLMAASSLLSIMGLLQMDRIVHQDLYKFGLEFSYTWARPYWTLLNIVFTMGWLNIITAVAFQSYVVIQKRKETLKTGIPEETQVIKEEKAEIETKPTEKAEEQKEAEQEAQAKPTEALEAEPKETPAQVVETVPEEKKEETQTTVEAAPSQGQTQPTQTEQVEERKEQPPEPQAEQKETTSDTQDKSEETPIIIGVPQEEHPSP